MAKTGIEYHLVTARKLAGGAWQRTPEPVKTKKSATERIASWREHHESNGWLVEKIGYALVARKDDEERSIALHEYDAVTHDRIINVGSFRFREVLATGEIVIEKEPKPVEKKPATAQPRRGRGKPAYA